MSVSLCHRRLSSHPSTRLIQSIDGCDRRGRRPPSFDGYSTKPPFLTFRGAVVIIVQQGVLPCLGHGSSQPPSASPPPDMH